MKTPISHALRHAGLLLTLLLLGCAGPGGRQGLLETAAAVDLDRFMGQWYVIANIPYFPERGKVASSDVYALREDGRIDNTYVFRRDFDTPERRWHGISEVQPDSAGAHWKVQFIWPFKTDLLVLEVDPDYQWALLGHPRRSMAWIFAREANMDDDQYQRLLTRMVAFGYERSSILRVPQFAEQVGKPGFQ